MDKVQQAIEALSDPLVPWMPSLERKVLMGTLHGEARESIADTVLKALDTITTMPVTYEQSELGDEAIVHLHYFHGASDWWITEKDIEGGVHQAYGFVRLNGDTMNAEEGYIDITELTQNGVELDLYWTPKTLAEIKASIGS